MYALNMNKPTLTEDTKQEEIWSDEIIGKEEL